MNRNEMWDEEFEAPRPYIRVLEVGDGWTIYINHRTEEIWTEQDDAAPIAASFGFSGARSVHFGK